MIRQSICKNEDYHLKIHSIHPFQSNHIV